MPHGIDAQSRRDIIEERQRLIELDVQADIYQRLMRA